MECTLTGCKKKGSLFLVKKKRIEFSTVSVKSKFLRFPHPVTPSDIISPQAQADIYFWFVIPSCAAAQLTLIKCSVRIIFGHWRWLNSAADVQKEGERGDRKTTTPQPPKGMECYTKGVPFLSNMVCGKVRTWTSGQGFPVKICWVPPGDKMPPTSNSNTQPLEMNRMVYERSTFSANC